MWHGMHCSNEGLAQELPWAWAEAVALTDHKLDTSTEGRCCWQLLGSLDSDTGTCWVRKKEELGGSPTFASPVAFAGCSRLPCTARTALVLLKFWAPSKQRTPETPCGKNIWLKSISVAAGSTGNECYTMQSYSGLIFTGRKFNIARWV